MPAAGLAPDEIALGAFALVIGEAAFQHISLLDPHMFVLRQLGARLPVEQGGE